jgi:hypothetical protein
MQRIMGLVGEHKVPFGGTCLGIWGSFGRKCLNRARKPVFGTFKGERDEAKVESDLL